MRFKLVDIGRGKVTREVDLKDPENRLIPEVGKHLGSNGIDISFDGETGIGTVLVGGCRPVGKIEPLDEEALAWARGGLALVTWA